MPLHSIISSNCLILTAASTSRLNGEISEISAISTCSMDFLSLFGLSCELEELEELSENKEEEEDVEEVWVRREVGGGFVVEEVVDS